MATSTPPPYFPQGSLSPPDPNKYRNFKLVVFGVVIALLALVGGAVVGVVYLLKHIL